MSASPADAPTARSRFSRRRLIVAAAVVVVVALIAWRASRPTLPVRWEREATRIDAAFTSDGRLRWTLSDEAAVDWLKRHRPSETNANPASVSVLGVGPIETGEITEAGVLDHAGIGMDRVTARYPKLTRDVFDWPELQLRDWTLHQAAGLRLLLSAEDRNVDDRVYLFDAGARRFDELPTLEIDTVVPPGFGDQGGAEQIWTDEATGSRYLFFTPQDLDFEQTDDPRTDDPRTDDPRTDDPKTDDPRTDASERFPTMWLQPDAPACVYRLGESQVDPVKAFDLPPKFRERPTITNSSSTRFLAPAGLNPIGDNAATAQPGMIFYDRVATPQPVDAAVRCVPARHPMLANARLAWLDVTADSPAAEMAFADAWLEPTTPRDPSDKRTDANSFEAAIMLGVQSIRTGRLQTFRLPPVSVRPFNGPHRAVLQVVLGRSHAAVLTVRDGNVRHLTAAYVSSVTFVKFAGRFFDASDPARLVGTSHHVVHVQRRWLFPWRRQPLGWYDQPTLSVGAGDRFLLRTGHADDPRGYVDRIRLIDPADLDWTDLSPE